MISVKRDENLQFDSKVRFTLQAIEKEASLSDNGILLKKYWQSYKK